MAVRSQGSDKVNEDLERLQKVLRSSYGSLRMHHGLPWLDDDVAFDLDTYHCDLGLVTMDIRGRRTPAKSIALEDTLDGLEPGFRVLVEGSPGFGKTTLGLKLCHDWAEGEDYMKDFDLVVLVPLRYVEGDFEDVVVTASGSQSSEKESVLRLLKDESCNILLVLDGYDEVLRDNRRNVLLVVRGEQFGRCNVVVTSRQEDVGFGLSGKFSDLSLELDMFFHRRISVLGINAEKRDEFVRRHLPGRDERKVEIVTSRMADLVGEEFLKCPLFLLMSAAVLTDDEAAPLPSIKTKTDLYRAVHNFMLRRYFCKKLNAETGSGSACDLFKFDRDNPPEYASAFARFGELAFQSLASNRLSCSEESILAACNQNPIVLEMGTLTKLAAGMLVRAQSSTFYEPVHRSVHEFSAAYFVWYSFVAEPYETFLGKFQLLVGARPSHANTSLLIFPFLAGLMGEDVGVLFTALGSYAPEYFKLFGCLWGTLSECGELNGPTLSSLTPYLPSQWSVGWLRDGDGFSRSSQHKQLVGHGIDTKKIDSVVWYLDIPAAFPDDTRVDTLVLVIRSLKNLDKLVRGRFSCKKLEVKLALLDGTHAMDTHTWPNIVHLLNSISFDTISFYMNALECNDEWLPLIHRSVMNDTMEVNAINWLSCTISEDDSLPLLSELVQNGRVEGLSLDLIPDFVSAESLDAFAHSLSSNCGGGVLRTLRMANFFPISTSGFVKAKRWRVLLLYRDFKPPVRRYAVSTTPGCSVGPAQVGFLGKLFSSSAPSLLKQHNCGGMSAYGSYETLRETVDGDARKKTTELSLVLDDSARDTDFSTLAATFPNAKICSVIVERSSVTRLPGSFKTFLASVLPQLSGVEIHGAERNVEAASELVQVVLDFLKKAEKDDSETAQDDSSAENDKPKVLQYLLVSAYLTADGGDSPAGCGFDDSKAESYRFVVDVSARVKPALASRSLLRFYVASHGRFCQHLSEPGNANDCVGQDGEGDSWLESLRREQEGAANFKVDCAIAGEKSRPIDEVVWLDFGIREDYCTLTISSGNKLG